MKREIDVFDSAADIMKALQNGALLITKHDGRINAMTNSWGALGIEWGKPVFITFVREHRFTKALLDAANEFTVSIPVGSYDKKILGVCGSKSGRNTDKLSELRLSPEEPAEISVPGVKELPLTLECRVIYKQAQSPDFMTPENKEKFHPQAVSSDFPMANRDYHTAYYGEIVKAYIIE